MRGVGGSSPLSRTMTLNEALRDLQNDLIILVNPHMFADTSGRVTDLSGISDAESWKLEVAIDNIKKEMQFIIDIKKFTE